MTPLPESRTIFVRGERHTLTPETILATRRWYANNSAMCIYEAEIGKTPVNDLRAYREFHDRAAADIMAGRGDNSAAFIQRAWFIQSGECVGLLS